ncbi:SixA phosphatase family protein [Nevskia soli]|uniref:SixA phosphatase family protein n=1 Tax=Nevskia soli TaxID=418856 RepID=UPI0004A6C662|nr:histidine phosphatase family protein [Nevskia soli]
MRRLTLIRHAKSSWDYAELSDFERPLNARGRRDAPVMAARLAPQLERPLRLISSPALRAITTAHIFAAALAVPNTAIRIDPRIYEATRGTLLGIVREGDDADSHVLLFGHNPGFSELAQLLAPCPFTDLPTCAVVTIGFEARQWRDIRHGGGVVQWYDFPKKNID